MEKLRSDAKISPQRVTIACEFTLKPEYEEQFRRWLPFYRPHDWVGKRFVDVGCGMGRNSYWPMSYGAAGGVAIDVDERSLAAARRNLAPFPTVEVRHMSAYDIDAIDAFHIVFSIGVIHHLNAPGQALARMRSAVKPGWRSRYLGLWPGK